ncbi:hypothetical protein BH09MYX1_BH09MYX1_58550 [soil metagenome]
MIRSALHVGALVSTVLLAPPKVPPRPPTPPARPSAPIPSLPVVTRIHVAAGREATVVTEEVTFARGDWQSGDIDAFIAFGGPGTPRAFDAHLLSPSSAAGPDIGDVGEQVITERAPRKPQNARALIGRETSAGEILHLRESALRRAFARSGLASVRIRSLLAPIQEDAQGGREVLIRLGSFSGIPLTVARIELQSLDGHVLAAPADAHYCGVEADTYPILVQMSPPLRTIRYPAPGDPKLIVRHPTDDLCLRFVLGT